MVFKTPTKVDAQEFKMKCENCGNELAGAAIVCRQCNHNNAQGRVNQWRARRTGELPKPATRSLSPLDEASVSANPPRKQTSIPFEPAAHTNRSGLPSAKKYTVPPAPQPATANGDDPGVIQYPAWRAELREKVRQVRERNGAVAVAVEIEPDEAQLDPNPIVESALKRIRWSNQNPPGLSQTRISTRSSQATALALDPEYDSESGLEAETGNPAESRDKTAASGTRSETKPSVHTAPNLTNPLLGRRTTQPVNKSETRTLPAQQKAVHKSEPKPAVSAKSDARINIPPASQPQTRPGANPFAAPKPAGEKVRTTGEIKRPQPTARTQTPPAVKPASPTVATPPSHQVETQVIEISPSVSTVAGYVNIGAATRPKPRPASLWVRTLAGACDFEIIAIAFLPLFSSYATLNTSVGSESFILMFVLLAVLTFCYQILTLTLADRTSGMALLLLRLVNISDVETPISRSQILARAVAATVACLCPPLNFIVMQSNQHGHSLPDLISGTTLIERSSLR